jgi:hypothetical protein
MRTDRHLRDGVLGFPLRRLQLLRHGRLRGAGLGQRRGQLRHLALRLLRRLRLRRFFAFQLLRPRRGLRGDRKSMAR